MKTIICLSLILILSGCTSHNLNNIPLPTEPRIPFIENPNEAWKVYPDEIYVLTNTAESWSCLGVEPAPPLQGTTVEKGPI